MMSIATASEHIFASKQHWNETKTWQKQHTEKCQFVSSEQKQTFSHNHLLFNFPRNFCGERKPSNFVRKWKTKEDGKN